MCPEIDGKGLVAIRQGATIEELDQLTLKLSVECHDRLMSEFRIQFKIKCNYSSRSNLQPTSTPIF